MNFFIFNHIEINMRNLKEYIDDVVESKALNEGLMSWFHDFVGKVKNNMKQKLDTNGTVEKVKMDVKKLKKNNKILKLSEINNTTANILKDKAVGFPHTYDIYKNYKKYGYEDLENLNMYTYFYKDEMTYFAATLIYDDNTQYETNYKHIVLLETNNIVANINDIEKEIISNFTKIMKQENKDLAGFTSILLYPDYKKTLIDMKFKRTERIINDKEIYKLDL